MTSPFVFDGTRLDLEKLAQLASRPPLFAPHDSLFWNDPHISHQMLAAHLDPTKDAASRRPEIIDRTVAWLVAYLRLRPGQRVLELGCGPGLYCERLARCGLEVVGVDLSPNSIEYAKQSAREQGLPIEYVCLDYRRLDRDAEFDAAFLIYDDFGVLADVDRDGLLRRARRALKPNGAFVFDVLTANAPGESDGARTWSISTGGFWKPEPYLELTQHFHYPEAAARVRQVLVLEADGQVSHYRIWQHCYSPETVAHVLQAHGFTVESIWGDLTGQSLAPDSPELGVVARRL
jgi:cyclopropane fatty-acyl-phospholipid synthase-like methyltransferase